MSIDGRVQAGVPLSPRTTLELGGAAAHYIVAEDDETVTDALRWARDRGLGAFILGGGSNLVVADAGVDGLVIEMAQRGIVARRNGVTVRVEVAAGEDWDALVAHTVAQGWAGLECLSGIPGRAGATPIQNVGAYGQEVSSTIESVRVLDRATLSVRTIEGDDCGFAYRHSHFKRHPDRMVVLGVTFRLVPDGPPTVVYRELQDAVGDDADLATVRDTVLRLRRRKSMVLDPSDPNRRSAGSFFTNPIVDRALAEEVLVRCVAGGYAKPDERIPRWPTDDGRVKLAAAWLIERAGFPKGSRRGAVGQSSAHALALVHHGGGRTADLLAYAEEVRETVRETFGVTLEREPRVWGVPAA